MGSDYISPAISVVIATYNDSLYIEKAVRSILNQSFQDFEVIVVNDASTDGTGDVLDGLCQSDKRIRVLHNRQNRGLAYSLNRGLSVSKGKYIARMDGDDIALSKRLEKQFLFMESHTEVDICGTNYKRMGMDTGVVRVDNDSDAIKALLAFCSPLGHSTWFVRAAFLKKYNLKYNNNFRSAQDYELLYRCMQVATFACLQEVLLLYRVHTGSITAMHKNVDENVMRVQRRIFQDLELKVSKRDLILWNSMCQNISVYGKIKKTILIHKVLRSNKKHNVFTQSFLIKVVVTRCFDGNKSIRKIFQRIYG